MSQKKIRRKSNNMRKKIRMKQSSRFSSTPFNDILKRAHDSESSTQDTDDSEASGTDDTESQSNETIIPDGRPRWASETDDTEASESNKTDIADGFAESALYKTKTLNESKNWELECKNKSYATCNLPDVPCEYQYWKRSCEYNPKLVSLVEKVKKYDGDCLEDDAPYVDVWRGKEYCTHELSVWFKKLLKWLTWVLVSSSTLGFWNLGVGYANMINDINTQGLSKTTAIYAKRVMQGVALAIPTFFLTSAAKMGCILFAHMTMHSASLGFTDIVGMIPSFDPAIFGQSNKDILVHSVWSVCHGFATSLRKAMSLDYLKRPDHSLFLTVGVAGAAEETMFRGKNFDILDVLKKPTFALADKLARLYKKDHKNFRKHAVSFLVLIISSIAFGLFHLQNLPFQGKAATLCQVFFTTIMGFFLQKFAPLVDGVLPLWIAHFLNNYLAAGMYVAGT